MRSHQSPARGDRFIPIGTWGPLFQLSDAEIFDHESFKELEPKVVAEFRMFHVEHPGLAGLYAKYARDLKAAGKQHFGIKAIAERVRWHLAMETVHTQNETFKVNNNFSSAYARYLMLKYQDLEGMFELRTSHGRVTP